ncbi:FtsX-like permease family protein [Clostridium beijerinckii]|uniref:FtsX-like permease family protein n=1 Tax=Clostridium beijerinckii TaxID=1520 RepID=UPI000479C6C8|nr:ABC transporter permease [Clostridium beijerinckii]
MYFKLAYDNIKKSYKDYTIYFLTLILAVCIFYSFNSIDSQKALFDMESSTANYMDKLIETISAISMFVSVVLGSLILYANNFLIKKRKKELGIYMTLGMGKRKISRILVTETFMVGGISLIAGLILGIVTSQVLSTFILKLFDDSMDGYRFIVSINAIGKTILCFGIMFLLVIIFNIFVISKYKIIDLLAADKRNENMKFKNLFIYLTSFILSVASLTFTYKTFLGMNLYLWDSIIIPALVFLIVGTVLFFFSLSGIILYIISNNKKAYFKGLNIFIVKQIYSKINTNFISMSVICLMLFITILALTTGIGLKKGYEAGFVKLAPFDASVILYTNDEISSVEELLNKINFKKSENEKYAIYNEYVPTIELKSLFGTEDKVFGLYSGSFVKISEYNKILKLKGEKEINLNRNEVLILSNYNKLIKLINEKLKNSNEVTIKGKEFLVKNHETIQGNLEDFIAPSYCTIVINDEFLSHYKVFKSVLNVMYTDKNREENNKKYDEIEKDDMDGKYEDLNLPIIGAYSKDSIYSMEKRSSIGALFIRLYLGAVLLITSMAILSLKQLSEASDSVERYRALKRIGVNKNMINKTIFIQTSIYFSLPGILALIHSIIGITVINKVINSYGQMDIRFSASITALIFVVVYTAYFYITYTSYRDIVKNNI